MIKTILWRLFATLNSFLILYASISHKHIWNAIFMNVTGFVQLHNGPIWQQYEKTQWLTNAMYELAKTAVGEEKAKAILEKHEVKLLN